MGFITAKDVYDIVYNSYKLNNAYEEWKEYRERITSYIIKHTTPGKSIAIFGAGESNDIDLKQLYEHLGNITLIDIREEEMQKALVKYGLVGKPNITIISKDFFGITKEEYLDVINICIQDMKRAKQFFSPLITAPKVVARMKEIYGRVNANPVDLGEEHFDYTVMIGVHSQINAFIEHAWSYFLLASGKSDEKVAKCAMEENDILMPRINEALLNLTNDIAFVGLELFENGRNCTVQGAMQAGLDMLRRIDEKEVINDVCWQDVWPLKQGVSYNMVIYKAEIVK